MSATTMIPTSHRSIPIFHRSMDAPFFTRETGGLTAAQMREPFLFPAPQANRLEFRHCKAREKFSTRTCLDAGPGNVG